MQLCVKGVIDAATYSDLAYCIVWFIHVSSAKKKHMFVTKKEEKKQTIIILLKKVMFR